MNTNEHNAAMVRLITNAQPTLYRFIRSLLPDLNAAQDVLQEANLILWRKADEFRPELNFIAWACTIARYQVLAYRRDRSREQQVFDQSLFDELADEAAERLANRAGGQLEALERCLQKLSPREREFIEERYAEGGSVKTMAERGRSTVNAVSRKLFRLRQVLRKCVEQSLALGGA
jgi:RNA polymerase sigma-70 factor (ECF subfamily)